MDELELNYLTSLIYGDLEDTRRLTRELIGSPEFTREHGISFHRHRKNVMRQLRNLSKAELPKIGFPEYVNGGGKILDGVALFEELVLRDPSLQIKYGVHYGLFSSAILNLGTPDQHKLFLPDALSLRTPGIFAMTETGHGSDVSSLQTTATFDKDSDSFVIHTPDRSGWKDYLGNAAKHGKSAVVFAQLIMGGENYGVHAFYVPIRNSFGMFRVGITGEDDGAKGGLNGVDNGRLAFNQVRVPRANLLAKYGAVDEAGAYSSPIESKGRRFFTMLSTLVQGRVSLVGAVVNAQKLALSVGVSYAHSRTQFENASGEETALIRYPLHQERLIPILADTYAQIFMHHDLLRLFGKVFTDEEADAKDRSDLETQAAAAKAYSTWAALNNLQAIREACGGQGYLAANQIVSLHADLDVYATFEGDNNVLLQLVAKRLLDDYSSEWKTATTVGKVKLAWDNIALPQLNHVAILSSLLRKNKLFSEDSKNALETLDTILSTRVSRMTHSLAMNIKKEPDLAEGFVKNQVAAVETALAYAEYQSWSALYAETKNNHPDAVNSLLTDLLWVQGAELIEKHALWYLTEEILSPKDINQLKQTVRQECYPRIVDASQALVQSFDLNDFVSAPIAKRSS